MSFVHTALETFREATRRYHDFDSIDHPCPGPGEEASEICRTLYRKNWIDAAQWHMEDLIREPGLDPARGMELKRRIDRSNQERTDMVEHIDSYFRDLYSPVVPLPEATINTESPAWALDRLSILVLKIWHMEEQTRRADAPADHLDRCRAKLQVLREQESDLAQAIDALLSDIAAGRKYMKVYRQMKMYNDPAYAKKQ